MTTFTIDTENNITAFPAPDQAEAVIAAGAQPFATSEELTQLASDWPAERLLAIWNSLPGVAPANGFKNPKAAASKIWGRVQGMAEPEKPIDAAPKSERQPKGDAQSLRARPPRVRRVRRPPRPRNRPKALRLLRNQANPKRAHRARAARPRRWSRCCNARMALRFPRLWRRWVGSNTRFVDLWPGR